MVLAARYKHSFLCDLIVHLTPALHSACPDTARLHAVYKVPSCTQHPVPATGQVTRHQAEYGPCGYCGRWNIEWIETERRKIIVWPQNLLSFNFIKGIKKQGCGRRWTENHLWMYILEWIPTLIVHCSSNEALHVRISACFVCGLYLNYTIRTIAHPLVSYWPQGNVLILQVCCCITTQQSHSIPFHEGLNML